MDPLDFRKTLDSLRASAQDVDALIRHYEARINQLETLKEEAEEAASKSQAQIYEAENKAQLAINQYQKALALREGEYQGLIRDLFEAPQQNLEKSIREQTEESKRNLEHSIRQESQRTNKITLSVAVLSILASIVMSIVFQLLTYRTTESLVASVKAVEGRTQTLVANIWQNDPRIAEVVREIQKHRRDFKDYGSVGDISLMYKLKLIGHTDIAYSEIVQAFEYAGIDRRLIPKKEQLKKWDEEYLALCEASVRRYSNIYSTGKFKEKVADDDRQIGSFRSKEDKTDYGGWRWAEEDLTYQDLYGIWTNQAARIRARMNINGQEQVPN